MANENQERRYITGETFDEVCDRYRQMMKANEGKSLEERKKAINNFRCGFNP